MDENTNTNLSKHVDLELKSFIRQLGSPHALIPEENQRLLGNVIKNQHMIMQVIEFIERQEAHKLLSETLDKVRAYNEIMTQEKVETLDDKALVAYGRNQTAALTKLMDVVSSAPKGPITQNLFVTGSRDAGKSALSADDRTAMKKALEQMLAQAAISESEEVEDAEIIPDLANMDFFKNE